MTTVPYPNVTRAKVESIVAGDLRAAVKRLRHLQREVDAALEQVEIIADAVASLVAAVFDNAEAASAVAQVEILAKLVAAVGGNAESICRDSGF
jgi:hypothetical protein